MSKQQETNILAPIVDALWDGGKALGNLMFGLQNNIDWTKEFEYLKLVNKDGITPRLKSTNEDKYYKRYTFTLPIGISVKDFDKHLDRFATIFHMGDDFESLLRVSRDKGYATIVVDKDTFKDELFEYTNLSEKFKPGSLPNIRIPLGYYVGEDWKLHLLWVDLANPNTPHFSVSGTTGSGKSNVVRLLLTHLFRTNTPGQFTASLSDLKGTELGDFKHLPHITHFTDDAEQTCGIIDEIVEMMEQRYNLLKSKNCKDISDYLATGGKMSYHLLLIDEFPELSILADSKYCEEVDPDVIAKLRRLLNKGRSCGIIVGLSTQTNKATTLPTELRSNIPVTIGLKARDKAHSEGICGSSGLEHLRGTGMSNVYGLVEKPFFTIRTLYMPKSTTELHKLLLTEPVKEAKQTIVVSEKGVSENVKTISGFDLNKEELFKRFRGIKEEPTPKKKQRHRNSKKSDLVNKLDSLK